MTKINKTFKSISFQRMNESLEDQATSFQSEENKNDWYKKLITNSGTRQQKIERYDYMDQTTTLISKALDIISDEVSSQNVDVLDPFVIDFDDETKVRKRDITNLQKMKDIWLERTNFKTTFFEHVRETLKYGFKAFLRRNDGSLKELYISRFVGYVVSPNDDTLITHYVYDATKNYSDEEDAKKKNERSGTEKRELLYLPIEDLVIFKIGFGPYGESILDRVYALWRKVQLLEDAVVIHRVVKAPERKIFKVDVGSMPVHKAESYIQKLKIQHRQKQVVREGQLDSEFDPMSMTDNYWLPQWGNSGKGSSIETIGGQSNQDGLEDLKYFSKELASGLKVPFSLLSVHQDKSGGGVQFNEQNVENVLSEEIRFINYSYRTQKFFNKVLEKEFFKFCRDREVEIPERTQLYINPPTSLEYYRKANRYQLSLNVLQSSQQNESLSEKFKLKELLQLDDEQIKENEHLNLLEKGLTEDQIKEIPEHEIHALVYGNSSKVKEKYGIQDEEENQGFGGF